MCKIAILSILVIRVSYTIHGDLDPITPRPATAPLP